jgi:hypothetical protein
MIVAVKTNYHTRGALPAVRLVSRDKLHGVIYPPEDGKSIELLCSRIEGERGTLYTVASYSEALRKAMDVLQQKADRDSVALCAELDGTLPKQEAEVLTEPATQWTMPKWVVQTKGK